MCDSSARCLVLSALSAVAGVAAACANSPSGRSGGHGEEGCAASRGTPHPGAEDYWDQGPDDCALTSPAFRKDVPVAVRNMTVGSSLFEGRPLARCLEVGSNLGCLTQVLLEVCELVFAADIEVHLHGAARASGRSRPHGGSVGFSRVVYLTVDAYAQPWWQWVMLNDVELVVVDAIHTYDAIRADTLNAVSLPSVRFVLYHDHDFPEVYLTVREAEAQGLIRDCVSLGERRAFQQPGEHSLAFKRRLSHDREAALWLERAGGAQAEGAFCYVGHGARWRSVSWAAADYVQRGMLHLWPADIQGVTFGAFSLYSMNVLAPLGIFNLLENGSFLSPFGGGCYLVGRGPYDAPPPANGALGDEVLWLCKAGSCERGCQSLGFVTFTVNRQGISWERLDGARFVGLRAHAAQLAIRLVDRELRMRNMP